MSSKSWKSTSRDLRKKTRNKKDVLEAPTQARKRFLVVGFVISTHQN